MAARLNPDILIAGAGPAGAVAALRLAEAGRRVVILDRSEFPRDKACGDGLIADAIAALRAIGLDGPVIAAARKAGRLRTFSPGGVEVAFDAEFLVLPRRVFDHLILQRAIAAGAEFRRFVVDAPIRDGTGVVVGVTGGLPGAAARSELRAPLTILATGAAAGVLRKFDDQARVTSSGIAVRTYARRPAGTPDLTDLLISLERELLPGYAWAFPAPDGLVNVGVGSITTRGSGDEVNLRRRLDDLLAGGGRVGQATGPMTATEPYRGAPLRTGLTGARLGQPGLAVIGEAAGTTYGVTGEGIGKAMESGILVAQMAAAPDADLASAGLRYASVMKSRHAARFRAYDRAERWVAVPLVADYVARRANRSRWVHEKLTGVITEQTLPTRLFSVRSLWRLVMHR